jgi:predicted nucleic acid-binding protein
MAFEPAFADTSFFFALAAKRDRTHEPAVKAFTRLLRLQRPLVTTDYVLDETLTLTKARTSAKVALALLDRIESSPALSIQHITHDRFAAAKAFFRKHADHGYSFTDCTSFVLMHEMEIRDVLTTDRHFAEAGFRTMLRLS